MNHLTLFSSIAAIIVMLIIISAFVSRQINDLRVELNHVRQQRDSARKEAANLQQRTLTTVEKLKRDQGIVGRNQWEQVESLRREVSSSIATINDQAGELASAHETINGLRETLSAAHESLRELSGTRITPTDTQLILDMAGKLSLASPALHATQAFKDAREAKMLADRGQALLKRLRPTSEPEAAEDAA